MASCVYLNQYHLYVNLYQSFRRRIEIGLVVKKEGVMYPIEVKPSPLFAS